MRATRGPRETDTHRMIIVLLWLTHNGRVQDRCEARLNVS